MRHETFRKVKLVLNNKSSVISGGVKVRGLNPYMLPFSELTFTSVFKNALQSGFVETTAMHDRSKT